MGLRNLLTINNGKYNALSGNIASGRSGLQHMAASTMPQLPFGIVARLGGHKGAKKKAKSARPNHLAASRSFETARPVGREIEHSWSLLSHPRVFLSSFSLSRSLARSLSLSRALVLPPFHSPRVVSGH